jgi:leucyl-tRNA synthetase
MKDSEITMPVQFCGKTRFTMQVPADASKDDVEKMALADERTAKYTEGKQIIKTIVVPKKIINIVVK